eukprot:7563028-Pyramimonas_sp.AAC.2
MEGRWEQKTEISTSSTSLLTLDIFIRRSASSTSLLATWSASRSRARPCPMRRIDSKVRAVVYVPGLSASASSSRSCQ